MCVWGRRGEGERVWNYVYKLVISNFSFPADEERKAVWTKIIQRARLEELWKPSKRSVVCSMHFEEKYIYKTKCGLKRLKTEAFPSKHLAIIAEESGSYMEKSKNAEQLHSPAKSNLEIGDVNISDLNYIFDTPKKVKLRSQLRKKQILSEKHVRRIKTLQQKIDVLWKRTNL